MVDKILSVKIRNFKGSPPCFKTKINLNDYKQVALLLNDLESNGAPIKKSISEFNKNDSHQFPW